MRIREKTRLQLIESFSFDDESGKTVITIRSRFNERHLSHDT